MTTKTLLQLIKETLGLPIQIIADRMGCERAVISRFLGTKSGEGKKSIHFEVLKFAFQSGFEAEVLSIISGKKVEDTNALIAVSVFPDLKPEELARIIEVSKVSGIKKLPREVVIQTVLNMRQS